MKAWILCHACGSQTCCIWQSVEMQLTLMREQTSEPCRHFSRHGSLLLLLLLLLFLSQSLSAVLRYIRTRQVDHHTLAAETPLTQLGSLQDPHAYLRWPPS